MPRSWPRRAARHGRSCRPRSRAGTADVYPHCPQPISGRFTLVGKLAGDGATITVDYGIQGGYPDERTFKVSRSDAVDGSLLRCLWAQKKLAELLIFQKKNEKQIAALGKQFGMVTPYTSLLVLDTLEQYVQYDIAPPQSLAAMREEYMRRIDTLEHQKQKQKADKLAEVIRMWEGRVKWWETQFKYRKDFKYAGGRDETVSRGSRAPSRAGGGTGGMGGGMGRMASEHLRYARHPKHPWCPKRTHRLRPRAGPCPAFYHRQVPQRTSTRSFFCLWRTTFFLLRYRSRQSITRCDRRRPVEGRAKGALLSDETERANEDPPRSAPGLSSRMELAGNSRNLNLGPLRPPRPQRRAGVFAVYTKNRARTRLARSSSLDCADFSATPARANWPSRSSATSPSYNWRSRPCFACWGIACSKSESWTWPCRRLSRSSNCGPRSRSRSAIWR